MIKDFDELIRLAKEGRERKRLVVVAADDEHTLEGVVRAVKNDIVSPILIGDEGKIKYMLREMKFDHKAVRIIDCKDHVEAAKKAISLIRAGKGDFLMKGKCQTADLMKEVVNKETGLRKGEIMCHLGLFQIPRYGKLVAMTDGGMIPYPSLEQKVRIIENAVDTMKALGYDCPKVACLAAAEVVNPKAIESVEAEELKKMNKEGRISSCIVEGPISYDLALSKEAAKIKGYVSSVAGSADILLSPNMVAGNMMAKAWVLSGCGIMSGIVVGAKVPIVLVSRGASSEEKYLSIALAAAASKRGGSHGQ